ncbi:MAG: hypothetical protein CVV42_05850 [Candidatus Riflebacteria bacterium HGW-Riflebacteria-2]|nr:MAG: hypothetical protein CVV42_05850 [Candidatus Riflebacteria bacterium HGW-Riflebacteria-2]
MKMRSMLGFVAFCLCLFAGVTAAEPETFLLRLTPPEAGQFETKLEVLAKSRMQMLFMPVMDTYFRLNVDQYSRLLNNSDKGAITTESQIATATLDYYMPGQPNQGMSDSVLEQLLWVSGLGGRKTAIKVMRNHLGMVTGLEDIPDEHKMYYQHDLIYYPENPVKVGDSWQRKFIQPLAVDFHQAPYDIEISGEYSLKRLHNNGKEAEIAFKFVSEADYAMQQGNKVDVDVKLIREGSMLISLKDGWPRSVKSKSSFEMKFSEQNYIESEEEYKSVTSEIKVEKPEQND